MAGAKLVWAAEDHDTKKTCTDLNNGSARIDVTHSGHGKTSYETDCSISIEQAADMLGESTDNLRAKIEEHVWQ